MFAVVVFLLSSQSPATTIQDGAPLSLCAAMANPEKFDGKVIVIRAEYMSGDESTWLMDVKCVSALKLGDQEWPQKLHIWALEVSGMSKYPVDFEPDRTGLARLSQVQRGLVASGARVMATIEGQFQFYPLARGRFRGKERTLGFGHLNGFPAQLVVKRVVDISVVALER